MRPFLFILSILFSATIFAQSPAKKSLQISDFAHWETISGTKVSNNGKYVLFEQNKQKGDGQLIVKHGKEATAIPRGYKAVFGSGNDVVVFQIKPQADSLRQAKLNKVKKDKMPADSLGILLLKDGSVIKYPKLKSFKVPIENAEYFAFILENGKAKKDTAKTAGKESKTKQPGDDLVIFKFSGEDTTLVKNVVEYYWSKNGAALYIVQQNKDSVHTFSSVSIFESTSNTISKIFDTEGWITKITSTENADKYSFLHSKDTIDEKNFSLYLGEGLNEPKLIVNDETQGIPLGWSPSENGKLYFSQDGSKLFLGTSKSPVVAPKDTLLKEEKPKLDIWNWKDLRLQPEQKLRVAKDKKRTYLAVYYIEKGEFVQLADLVVKDVSILQKGNGNIGLGADYLKYQRSSSWTGKRERDFYLVDFKTGIKRIIAEKKSYGWISPGGKYFLWYDTTDSSYYAQSTNINDLEVHSLTKIIPVNFYNEWHDTPSDPRPYGVAGWSEDDRFVFIYDRFDIWKIDPSGMRVPVNVTKTFGRRNKTQLRYVKLDKDLEYIPTNEPVLLSGFDERTKSAGFFDTKLNTVKDPDLLIMDRYSFSRVTKAKEADKIIWTKEKVNVFPDVWCSNLKFEHAKKMSEANKQQKDFVWPQAQLVEWNSFAGEKLTGILYKPENLDPGKKYPMIVYFYERSSNGIHRYQLPKPSQSTINKAFYVSNDYLVFVPDITYKDGYPGQSAYNAVVSGTQFLINKYSFVDKDKIGLQGQSWGGYQIAWLVTQTDMYAAAMAGAPVSNMTSAYGGIRWGSGRSRMFQYEHTQSRIGGTLWEKPLLYIENSPVFHVPKITTPLLMMHNDKDGSVPWYQGIEMFVAMRRLNKPAWLLSYNNEDHNLPSKSWANRIDLSTRMFQFFNHFLKGKPAPEWMEKGVPALEKGENLGY